MGLAARGRVSPNDSHDITSAGRERYGDGGERHTASDERADDDVRLVRQHG